MSIIGDAIAMYDAGLDDVISVIPPGASLSPNSAIRPEQLGKIPGRRNASGYWHGYDWRVEPKATREQVATWAREWCANVGLRARNFPALDIDLPDAALVARVQDLASRIVGPASVRTGQAPKVLRPYRLEGAPFGKRRLDVTKDGATVGAVEVLGDGQQYLVAGTHPSGRPYTWNVLPTKLAPLSRETAERFLDAVRQELEALGYSVQQGDGRRQGVPADAEPDRAPSFALIEKAVRAIPNTEDTDRDAWVKLAHLIKGACLPEDEERGLTLFQEWSAAWPGNDPAENDRVYETATPRGGWHALREWADKCGLSLRLEETQAAFDAAEPATEADDPWVCVADALANPDSLKPPPAVLPRFAFTGRTTLLAAPEKAGKSTLIGQAVAALTTGGAFLEDQLAPTNVLWVCIDEHPEDLVRRLGRYGVNGWGVHFTSRLLPAHQIAAKIRATGAQLCVVDTLTEWITRQGGDPNREADVLKVIRPLRDVARDTGCAFVLLHHTVRAGDRYAGSHQIGASVDLLIEMRRKETRREFKPLGRFPVPPFTLAFDVATERYRLADSVPSLDATVLEAIRAAPGLSMSQLQQVVGKRREDVSAAVLRLLAAGVVRNEGAAGRWKLYPVDLGEVFAAGPNGRQGGVTGSGNGSRPPEPVDVETGSRNHVSAVPTTREPPEPENGSRVPPYKGNRNHSHPLPDNSNTASELVREAAARVLAPEPLPVSLDGPAEPQVINPAATEGPGARPRFEATSTPLTPEELAAHQQSEEQQRERRRERRRRKTPPVPVGGTIPAEPLPADRTELAVNGNRDAREWLWRAAEAGVLDSVLTVERARRRADATLEELGL